MTRIGAGCVGVLMLAAGLSVPSEVAAQTSRSPVVVQAPGAQAQPNAPEVSRQFRMLLQQYPPSLPQILRLDPSLLTNDAFLAPYPELRAFLRARPEVARAPDYFLSFVRSPLDPVVIRSSPDQETWSNVNRLLNSLGFAAFVAGLSLTFVWLVRQLLAHRRWARATTIQTDLHTRLLERMQSADEIKTYLQSAEMTRFLTEAPVTLGDARTGVLTTRVLAALQAGIVLACAGAGILLVKRLIHADGSGGSILVFGGVLLLALGLGFALASWAAFALSRRVGGLTPARPGDAAPV